MDELEFELCEMRCEGAWDVGGGKWCAVFASEKRGFGPVWAECKANPAPLMKKRWKLKLEAVDA